MTEVHIFSSNNAGKWNSLVERNNYAAAYHLWEWGDVLSSTYRYQRYYLATTKNDEVTGILPLVHVKSKLFGNRFISLPFCEYGGLLVDVGLDDNETRQIIDALLNATNNLARTLGIEYVEMRGTSFQVTRDMFYAQGYDGLQKYVTFKVDLGNGPQELWNNLHKKTRNATRKAIKEHVEVEEVESVEQLKAYYRLYLETQKRHGSPPHNFTFFQKLFAIFHSKNKLDVLLATYKEEAIGGIIIFYHKGTIFWWNNVTDTKYRSLNPTNMLLWNTIERGVKDGYHALDLGRTRKETTIYHFKNGWGGQEMRLQEHVYFVGSRKKELPDPGQRRYEYFSKVWSLIPISLARRIGPKIVSGIAL